MIRAVICDIYGTLLEVGPPPADAEARWSRLWRDHVRTPQAPTLAELETAVRHLIPHHHAAGRARGLVQPEIDWPDLATHAFPALARLTPTQRSTFFFDHARLTRSTRMAPGAAPLLRALHASGRLIGIASNAQACTRLELAEALAAHRLSPTIFTESICFFSYAHGVAKPDPRVFHHLRDQLAALDIAPAHTLMVGDRVDTDVEPATTVGWTAWHLCPEPAPLAGDWPALQSWLDIG